MSLKGKKVGFAVTGSHCTFEKVLPEAQKIIDKGAEVIPIMSESVQFTDTRFGLASKWYEELQRITGQKPITSIVEAEPIGPQVYFDALIIAPCTGNTLSKLALGITDGTVLMAAKAHLRNQRPLIIAISTNDGLGNNAKNISILLNSKNIYFVPFGQDDPFKKPNSLIAQFTKITDTLLAALEGKQIQPIIHSYF